jgi:hypothetical protein
MQTNTWVTVLLTAVVFAVGGYFIGTKTTLRPVSVSTHPPVGQNCGGGTACNIEIRVGNNCNPAHPDPATCDVYAVQDVTVINADNKNITFDITTNGFTFNPHDGIAFTALNGGNTIFNCSPSGTNYNCAVTNPNNQHGPFKFTIHVQNLNVVDPWVVNY